MKLATGEGREAANFLQPVKITHGRGEKAISFLATREKEDIKYG